MQALNFVLSNWDKIAAVLALVGLGDYTRRGLKKKLQATLERVATEAVEDVLALWRRGGIKLGSLIDVWEVRVREVLGDLGIKVSHEQALRMRELAARRARQIFIGTTLPEFTHAVTEFERRFHDWERKLANADAALRKRSDETLATRVQKGG